MHYVELDVSNLRRWLRGDLGGSNAAACINGAGPTTCPMDITGFVVYFSDRRGNRDLGANAAADAPVVNTLAAPVGNEVVYGDDQETGELGFEDNINTNANSAPNNQLDHFYTDVDGNNRSSEDLNWELPIVPAANAPGRGVLDAYGRTPRLLPKAAANAIVPANRMLTPLAAGFTPAGAVYALEASANLPVDRIVARVNRAVLLPPRAQAGQRRPRRAAARTARRA